MDNDFKKILLTISEKWKSIFNFSLLLSLIALIYLLFFFQPDFTSTSKIYLSDKQSNQLSIGNLSQLGFGMPFSGGSAVSQLSVMGEIVGSSSFLESLLNENIKIDSTNVQVLHKWLNPKLNKNIDDHEYRTNSILKLIKMINVVENYESSIITVQVTTNNKYISQSINHLIIEKGNELLIKKDHEEAKNTLLFIEKRIKDVNNELEISENNLKNFRYKNINVSSSPDLQMQLDKLIRKVAFTTTIISTLLSEKEVSKIKSLENTNAFSVLEEPSLPFYASSTRRLFQLIIYVFFSVLIPVFLIIANIFRQNFFNYIKSINQV